MERGLIENPSYDWAFTVVRNYFYTLAKKVRLDSIKKSSYEPLQHVVQKISIEMSYHMMHWEVWFKQLINSTSEAKSRMEEAMNTVFAELGGVFSYGRFGDRMVRLSLIESEEVLKERWMVYLNKEKIQYSMKMKQGDGRNGVHTPHLAEALDTLSEVYQSVPTAEW